MAPHALPGSDRQPLPGARCVGAADSEESLEVSVVLRRGAGDALRAMLSKLASGDRSEGHLEREDFASRFGACQEHIAAVTAFAAEHGLSVVETHAARHTVVLSGSVAGFEAAFGVSLQRFEHPAGSYRGRTGPVHLPDTLTDVVEAVLGLDNRPIARSHMRRRREVADIRPRREASTQPHDEVGASAHGGVGALSKAALGAQPLDSGGAQPPGDAGAKDDSATLRGNGVGALPNDDSAALGSFSPTVLAALYGFPVGDGKGECVAIIELGGGYQAADLHAYFAGLGISEWPDVVTVSVDRATNQPTGDLSGPDGEVMLDIEVAGAIAPASRIAVYFAPNTDAGFLDAVTTAVHDTVNRPSVISISWGGPESTWTPQAMTAFDDALQAAAVMGITVCVAAGDNGSSDGAADGADHVDFPASSPHVLACGGTSLTAADLAISDEVGWNDGATGGAGGGGVSAVFALPAWQAGLSVVKTGQSRPLTMRGVPDVSGNADPETGYNVRIDGTDTVLGGTSAVAPLWAGLVARINATRGSATGFINPSIYRATAATRDITRGGNGDYAATPGWDACTGLGSPNGAATAAALEAPPANSAPAARKAVG